MEITFRKKTVIPTVETGLVQRTIHRTLNVHKSWPFIIWSGPAGAGKTETARHLVKRLDTAYLNDPENGFRARHFEVTSDPGGPNAGKRFLRTLHHRVISRLTDGEARTLTAEDLAEQIAEGCEHRGVQLLLIDEAGLLSQGSLRALCLLRSEAETREWPLSVVLIGMDELPRIVKKSPQVRRRVHEWCYFQPYAFNDTWDFAAAIHPHFAALDRSDEGDAAQVAFLHEELGGLPGNIVPFFQKLDGTRSTSKRAIDLVLLRAVHQLTISDEDRADKGYQSGWTSEAPADKDESGSAEKASTRPRKSAPVTRKVRVASAASSTTPSVGRASRGRPAQSAAASQEHIADSTNDNRTEGRRARKSRG